MLSSAKLRKNALALHCICLSKNWEMLDELGDLWNFTVDMFITKA